MKPNLFYSATTELSQDGFFTWLLQWADDDNRPHSADLSACAKEFVRFLIQKQIPGYSKDIATVRTDRQWENIDICAAVNNEVLIVIEDKKGASEHSDQLSIYKVNAAKWCKENGYQLVCIYLKTGSETLVSLKKVEKKGFSIVDREMLLGFFGKCSKVRNDIFLDFVEHVQNIQRLEQTFNTVPIKDWDWSSWTGFYRFLEKNLYVDWGYVPNPSGGFLNAVLNWEYCGDFPVYMQIEQGNLCFKISTHPDDVGKVVMNRPNIRQEWFEHVVSAAREANLQEIRRPDRFGNGNYMTVAVVDREAWLGKDDSIVEKEKVIANLKRYLSFFKRP